MKQKTCLAIVYENGDVFIDSTIKSAQDYTGLARPGEKFKVERVQMKKQEKRSLDQNALFHVWCQQISGFMGEDVATVKQILKIKFGFPVLLKHDTKGPQLRWILEKLGWISIPWTKKIKLCERWIPVTSAMSVSELKEMMDRIKEWAMSEYNITLDNGKID